ncbi:MAG: CRTAC1 family protein [Candidatus Poribacteria bacterium]
MKRWELFIIILSLLLGLWGCSADKVKEEPTRPPPISVTFTDVTAAAGINFIHSEGDIIELVSQTTSPGAAFADYDNDDDLDIYITNGSGLPNALYRNNGDGTFSDVARQAGVDHRGFAMGCVFGDYDNDGDLDLYVTNYNEPNLFFRNNGDGTFTDVTLETGTGDDRWGVSAAFADYDNDGDLDLYVVNYIRFAKELAPKNFVLVERAEDNVLLAPEPYDPQGNVLYRNNGDGTFTDVTAQAGVADENGRGLSAIFGDYDNDGDADLFVANDISRNKLYRNNGDGTFEDASFLEGVDDPRSGMGVDWGDYDNDGDLDLYVGYFKYQANALYRNNLPKNPSDGEMLANFDDIASAAGLAEPCRMYVTWGAGFLDYDNNGYLDIFAVNGNIKSDYVDLTVCIGQPDFLFHNNGDGTFEDVSESAGAWANYRHVGRGTAFGDYDGDGDIDIFIANNNGPAVLLRNDGGNQNNWLHIRLIGTKSNRDGIGARVTVKAGGLAQTREVIAGNSVMSQSSLEVAFGLGNNPKVEMLKIRWPSGIVQTMKDIAANQIITVVEKQN